MSDDLFEDSTMTFGEHIEELRQHLWRAIKGVAAVMIIMTFFADKVVKVLTDPVERELHDWTERHYAQRLDALEIRAAQMTDSQEHILHLDAVLTDASLNEIAEAVLGARPKTPIQKSIALKVQVPIATLLRQIAMPMAEVDGKYRMKSLAAQEAFVIYFKAVLGAAIVVASPWVFYQLYSFVAVGLYAHEKRFVNMTLPFSVSLFLSGVAVCFFLVFPAMLKFFLGANEWMDIEPDFRLSEWVGFAVILMVIFGVTFQMPLLMLVLEKVGIVSHRQLAGKRKMAVFVNFCVAAVITPGGDPNTMLLLGLPMCVLFELGLFLMRYFGRRENKDDFDF